jgi:hypothetical protein
LEDYIFTDQVSSNAIVDVDVSLFNEPKHLAMQSSDGWRSFYLLHNKHNRIEGLVHFHVEASVARSPFKAPFGSFEFSATVPLKQRYNFINFTEIKLKQQGVHTVILKNPLREYDSANISLLEVFLLNNGWRVDDAELGCILNVRQPIAETFDSWEARKFRQANDAGLVFKEVSIEHLDEIYLFILACREKKKYMLSMPLNDLRAAFETFPDRYALFGIYLEDKLIAASVTVQVTKQVLYHFYTDHDDAFDKISPVVFLTVQLLKEAAKKNIDYFDLGTSAHEGQPNVGLLNFKMRLGGTPSSKLTFVKSLK